MKIYNTRDRLENVPVFMLLYGEGGIGKSTFAATAPGVLMADCEDGAKFFGRRGIEVVVANIDTWFDFAGKGQFMDIALADDRVKTIVIDPIGELMEKCKRGLTGSGLTTSDGAPTMRGWGEMGNRMGAQLRRLRDAGKNVILVAHVDEKEDEGRMIKRPLIQTKLSKLIPNMVDLVGYMHGKIGENGKRDRVISFDETDDKIEAKDRTGALGATMPPSFPLIQEKINKHGIKPRPKEDVEIIESPELPDGAMIVDKAFEDERKSRLEKLEAAKQSLKEVKGK